MTDMGEPMFNANVYLPVGTEQACQRCPKTLVATDDQLRARGWIVFDGPSVTGKQLHHRICPDCRA